MLYSWLPHSERSAWGHVKYDISELPCTGELMGNYSRAGELYDISLAKLHTFFVFFLFSSFAVGAVRYQGLAGKRYAAELPINAGRFFMVRKWRASVDPAASAAPHRPDQPPSPPGVVGEGPDTY